MVRGTVTEVRHSVEGVLKEIDAVARERRGMSAEEFLVAYHDGSLDDPGEMADLIVLADLLPEEALPTAGS